MPESGTFGSVRGVPGNRHSYRDLGKSEQRDKWKLRASCWVFSDLAKRSF
jgi:hypothetical protein